MAGLSVAVPPLRLRVRGFAPIETLTSGGSFGREEGGMPFPPLGMERLDLRGRECERRLDALPVGPAACALGAAAARAAVRPSSVSSRIPTPSADCVAGRDTHLRRPSRLPRGGSSP